MNFEGSLLKSYGLILVFLLVSISSGFCLTFQPKVMIFSETSFFFCPRQIDNLDKVAKEKNLNEIDKSDTKKNRRKLRRNNQEKAFDDFSTSSDQESESDSPVKSYNQLKGLLEEVDMMVGGWI
ncbi:hypothetical protein [Aquiflexum sp.]|uniref:hypothetical protein n=1 Tax=Aquiflexum sp. TaxID=1872584 RepID=UPI0035934B97